VHDDGETAGECDARLFEATSLGDLQRPAFQRKGLADARQDRVDRLVKQLANDAVTLLGDAAGQSISPD
jgi:hypothetical protein